MLEYIEVSPLPEVCRNCNDDCYNCEYAGERFILPEKDRIRLSMEIKKRQILRHKNDERMKHYIIKWLKEYEDLKNKYNSIQI